MKAKATKPLPLKKIAELSGISYKTCQAKFKLPGAPDRKGDVEELVEWVRMATPGKLTEIPPDYAQQLAMAKLTREKNAGLLQAANEEKTRLHNLEKKGLMVERANVVAQGAAVGVVLSSEISRLAKELPGACDGLGAEAMRLIIDDAFDQMLYRISNALEALTKEDISAPK